MKEAVLERSGGRCEYGGCKEPGAEFDHIRPVAFYGDNTLDNCRLLCTNHNAALGVDTARQAAKADRQAGRAGQYAKRKRRKDSGKPPKLKSAGFDKKWKRKMDGSITRLYNEKK